MAQGGHFVSAIVADLINDAQVGLTQRELQILNLVAQGIGLSLIAENLAISCARWKTQGKYYEKLNVTNSIRLVEAAHKLWVGGVQP